MCDGICPVLSVVLPTVPLTEPDTDCEVNADVNGTEPPEDTPPDTIRSALLSCAKLFVHPVGAEDWMNSMVVPDGIDAPVAPVDAIVIDPAPLVIEMFAPAVRVEEAKPEPLPISSVPLGWAVLSMPAGSTELKSTPVVNTENFLPAGIVTPVPAAVVLPSTVEL